MKRNVGQVTVTGYYYGEKFEVTVNANCLETIYNTEGVVVWRENWI